MGLWQDIEETMGELDRVNELAHSYGLEMVDTEAKYYSAKARAAFDLKERGYPVTFIELVIKGEESVKDRLRDYHAAQIEYDNARECVNVLKKKLAALNDQYQREWSQAGTR